MNFRKIVVRTCSVVMVMAAGVSAALYQYQQDTTVVSTPLVVFAEPDQTQVAVR